MQVSKSLILLFVSISAIVKAGASGEDAVKSFTKGVAIRGVSVLLSSRGQETSTVQETTYPQSIVTPLSAESTASFQVNLDIVDMEEGSRPHTTGLRLRCTETDYAVLLAASKSGPPGSITFKGTFEAVQAQLGFACPALQAAVLLGDKSLDKSIQWDLVRFNVNYTSAGKGGTATGSPQTRMQTLFQPQPTISHQFRQPDKRPPAAISLLFAAATAVPLVLLAAALLQLGVNFSGFPATGLSVAAAIAFHGGLAALLGLYAIFWLQLNLLQTLPILAVIALFLVLSGFKLLSLQADARLKST